MRKLNVWLSVGWMEGSEKGCQKRWGATKQVPVKDVGELGIALVVDFVDDAAGDGREVARMAGGSVFAQHHCALRHQRVDNGHFFPLAAAAAARISRCRHSTFSMFFSVFSFFFFSCD